MRECKKCKKVKFDFQFFKEYFCCPYGCIGTITWLCKKCANEIGYEKSVEEAKKFNK
jgi:hypothetical protein